MEGALVDSWSTVATSDGARRLFVTCPDGPGPFPGLVVLPGAPLVRDRSQDVCRRYAALGHLVVAPDLYQPGAERLFRRRIGPSAGLLPPRTDDQLADGLRAVLDRLTGDPRVAAGKVAVVGYGQGGRCAYLAAARFPEISGAVVYYGGQIATGKRGGLVESTAAIRCPVLVHVGEEDARIPPEQIRVIDAALFEAGVDYALVTYPGAGHGFACDGEPAGFHPEAAELAWDLTRAFLKDAFEGAGSADTH